MTSAFRLSEYHLGVLKKMGEVWPAVAGNQSAAIRLAIQQVDYQMKSPGRQKTGEESLKLLRQLVPMVTQVLENTTPAANTISAAKAAGCDEAAGYDDDGYEVKRITGG